MATIRRAQQWATMARTWWIFDAKWQCPIDSAELLAVYLQGKHKPIYHPLCDVGDHVVVINCKDIAMEGELWRTFLFRWETGYPKGKRTTRAWMMHRYDPTMVLRKMIYNTIPGVRNDVKDIMQRCHLFKDENVPPDILKNVSDQIRQLREIPKKLSDYSDNDIKNFPKLYEFPPDYVIEKS